MASSIYINHATSISLSYIEALSIATMPSPYPQLSGDNINVAPSTLVKPRPPQQAISLQNTAKAALGIDDSMPSSMIASCNWQLDNGEAVTLENMNFMLGMFRDEFPNSVCIQPAAYLESLHLSGIQKPFILPILDTVDEGRWSLIHVFYRNVNKEKHIPQQVDVQYYDSGCAPGRFDEVRKKVASWVESTYGKHMGVRFIEAKGPVDQDNPNMSGIHAIMAAREFAHYGSVTTKSNSWGGDPKDLLKVKLRQQEHQSPHHPPITNSPWSGESSLFVSPPSDSSGGQHNSFSSISPSTAATTPSTSPVFTQRKRPRKSATLKTTNKVTTSAGCNKAKGVLHPQNGQRKAASTTAASSASTSAAISNIDANQTNSCAEEPCAELGSEHQQVGKGNPVSLDVMKKMAEIVHFIQGLGLPAVDALQREREKLYAEFTEKKKASKSMEEEMKICDKEYEQRKNDHRSLGQQCVNIETDIKKKRNRLNGYLQELPSVSSQDNQVGITDLDIIQVISTWFETETMIPLQDSLTDNLSRKRKAGELLECAWQVCEERQEDLNKAGNEQKLAEIKSREACKCEELTAIIESFLKKTWAWNKAWETVEGGENKDWYSAFCQRRAQI
ncbi:hypothetical protein KAF25_004997 [Fusarium avenaceum]|uniref:Uncharacterized protein n=1 Tax=Fusarium avenaceum TaxID=40199 RepID=A0A9P7KUV2_9HYPO|nr:hypothetical protein KAF25_004997 [Fusarium avenaceum]